MCITEQSIHDIVTKALSEHEKREFENHKTIEDKLDEAKKIAMHNAPSPATLVKLGELQDLVRELQKSNDRLNRVVFGDPLDRKDIGMHGKIDEMYTRLIQVGGIKGFFKWIMLTTGVISTLYVFFKKF
jgi:hypothetical protein